MSNQPISQRLKCYILYVFTSVNVYVFGVDPRKNSYALMLRCIQRLLRQ